MSDTSETPGDKADPAHLVESRIPQDIRDRYEIHSYRSAALILSENHPEAFADLLIALREFSITTDMIRRAGGNESQIPKLFSNMLRPRGWHETSIQGDLLVTISWRESGEGTGKTTVKKTRTMNFERYLDGHQIDYVKDGVAFDLEWNSKDQTFDRDLYAFSAFAHTGVIDVAVLVTRSAGLNPVFRQLGESLDRNGNKELKKTGEPRMIHEKFGASTTWMGKLLYRLNAGRNGGCPVLTIGIGPKCIKDWPHGT